MLVEAYKRLKNSIVAFTPRFALGEEESKRFPPILGTGVIVNENGLIATNNHVIDAIAGLPHPDDFRGIPGSVLLFILTDQGMAQIDFAIEGIFKMKTFKPGKAYYGPKMPDLGFAYIKARNLPTVRLRPHASLYEEGEDIATAGFPMGTDHLTGPGWLHQFSPTLQSGIISAVHPFPCTTPHGFTINVMVQGGASGSPVFSRLTGEVLGLVYAGLYDHEIGEQKNRQRIPTNYTYAVPAHFIVNSLPQILQTDEFERTQKDAKSIGEIIAERRVINALSGDQVQGVKLPW
jgi:S1-C subfamily serine protease